MTLHDFGTLDGQRHAPKSREIILRRNEWIYHLFNHFKIKVETIGNPNHPMVIYNKNVALGTHIKNFDFSIKRDFYDMKPGNDLFQWTLQRRIYPEEEAFFDALREATHESVSRISLKGSDLCLAGYNFLSPGRDAGRYPVFAKFNCKYYPNIDYAQDITILLMRAGYEVELIDDAEPDDLIRNIIQNNAREKTVHESFNLI